VSSARLRLPEPLPAPALDAHTHLDMIARGLTGQGPGRPVSEVLDEARSAGVSRVVTVGVDLPTSRWAADQADEHPGVFAAVAIHPNDTANAGDPGAVLAELADLAMRPRVRAIGETGLDYYRDWSPPQVQRDWFRGHIEVAKRTGRALMIHDRDAHEDVLSILAAEGPPEQVIFHCFSGDADMAKRCAEAGYVMSFAGNVTFASAQPLREAAAVAPPELILVETDAPFLTPVPNRGKPNAPALAADTLRAIAKVKGMDVAELCAAVTATAGRVFGPLQD
jgi:TatD DNase family protein